MGLDKDSRALLVKLFYQNNNNSAAALHCFEDRTLRPAFSAMETVISGAIGRRPLQEKSSNRQLIRTSESCSSTLVWKEDLSIFL